MRTRGWRLSLGVPSVLASLAACAHPAPDPPPGPVLPPPPVAQLEAAIPSSGERVYLDHAPGAVPDSTAPWRYDGSADVLTGTVQIFRAGASAGPDVHVYRNADGALLWYALAFPPTTSVDSLITLYSDRFGSPVADPRGCPVDRCWQWRWEVPAPPPGHPAQGYRRDLVALSLALDSTGTRAEARVERMVELWWTEGWPEVGVVVPLTDCLRIQPLLCPR